MKKIALLHFASYPSPGGVEKLIEDHSTVLQRLGFSVKILTGSQIPILGSIQNFDNGLAKKILEKGKIDEDFYGLAREIYAVLAESLKDCDVIIVHNMLTVYRNLAFIYSFKQYVENNPHKKYINWVHDHMLIEEDKIKKNIKIEKFAKDLITKPLENVTYVTISQSFAGLLGKVIKAKILVIPDGLDLKKELEISDEIWNLVQKKDLMSKFPLLLCPANIVERKNIEFSIRLVGRLIKRYPKTLLIVTGDVSKHKDTNLYFQKLKDLVKEKNLSENVFFLTEIFDHARSDSDLRSLYMLCDAVLYFSKSENFGLPLLEAAVFRLPIFISDLKVFKEIGQKDLEYLNISSKDSVATAGKYIQNYLESSKNLNFKNRVKSEYNLDNILKEKLIPIINA